MLAQARSKGVLLSERPSSWQPAVYIVASQRNGTLYVGVTSDLIRRVGEQRQGLRKGFTERYGVRRLVWCEAHPTMEGAIAREKAIKKWRRAWKLGLIEERNPGWKDLAEDWGWPALPIVLPGGYEVVSRAGGLSFQRWRAGSPRARG